MLFIGFEFSFKSPLKGLKRAEQNKIKWTLNRPGFDLNLSLTITADSIEYLNVSIPYSNKTNNMCVYGCVNGPKNTEYYQLL